MELKQEERLQKLLDYHELMKAKWILLTEDDMFNRVKCWEAMKDLQAELRSEIYEQKIRLDNKKWQRMIELKLVVNEAWKKTYTDTTAEAQVRQEMEQDLIDFNIIKLKSDLLQSKIDTVVEYINIAKLKLKKDNVAI